MPRPFYFGRGRRKQKYNAKPVVENTFTSPFPEMAGRRFDSQLERRVAQDLCVRLHAGEISDLEFQKTVYLTEARISWRIDFAYIEDGVPWFHEVKGFPKEDYPFQIKFKLFRVYGPCPIRITEGTIQSRRTRAYYPTHYCRESTDSCSERIDGDGPVSDLR